MIVFVDSDVVVSSLISHSGAAYLLLNTKDLRLFISNASFEELKTVVKKLRISQKELSALVKTRLKIVELEETIVDIKDKYKEYVHDINDAHIVAGAKVSKARFLISYNVKDFRVNKIRNDLTIIVATPGKLLQYLRSLQ